MAVIPQPLSYPPQRLLGLLIGCGICVANYKKNAMLMEKILKEIPKKKHKLGVKTFLEMLAALLI